MDDFEAFLNQGGIVEPDDAMPDEYRTAVFRFIELHANSEQMGGLTERDWIPRTPGLRHKMAVIAKPKTSSVMRTCCTWSRPTWASRRAR